MEFQRLKSGSSKKIVLGVLGFVIVLSIIIFKVSYASYRTTQSINIANGKINYKVPDLRVVAIKLQDETDNTIYNDSDTIPTSGYTLNTDKSVCGQPDGNGYATKDSSIVMKYEDGYMLLGNLKKNTRCYLYFDIDNGINVTLAGISMTAKKGSTIITDICADASCSGLYYVSDGMYGGTTYYYRGAVGNNWVKFAGYYWRIIRFNGDGSIRMIYSGTTAPTSSTATVMTGDGTQIGTSMYNESNRQAEFAGYYYTLGESHGTSTASTIASLVNNWYTNYLTNYENFINQSGKYCNDRTYDLSWTQDYQGTGIGNKKTQFSGGSRAGWTGLHPRLFNTSCEEDVFYTPIGLITYDEMIAAGGLYNNEENKNYYLYTDQNYWSMTPHSFDGTNNWIFYISSTGGVSNYPQLYQYGIRPVINLKASTNFTGSGTYDDVYKVVGTDD